MAPTQNLYHSEQRVEVILVRVADSWCMGADDTLDRDSTDTGQGHPEGK
jgi:hypothetical protein